MFNTQGWCAIFKKMENGKMGGFLVTTEWPKCTDCTDFYPVFFFNFHSFQQFFHENFKKINLVKSKLVYLIFCILNNIRLINVSIDKKNSFIIFEIPEVFIWEYVPEVFIWECVYLSICLAICMSVYLFFIYLFILSVSLFIYMCLSVSLSIYLSVCLSIYVSVSLSDLRTSSQVSSVYL